MRPLKFLLLAVPLVACSGTGEGGAAPAPGIEAHVFTDPEVTRIHGRMIRAMAPDNGWERSRYIAFDWLVARDTGPLRRAHRWDRYTGEYRLESPVEGGTQVALFNVHSPTDGRVWIDGEELQGEARDAALRGALGAHVNDSYWLLMPYKWSDPGVNARYVGEETDADGRSWEVVELTFDGVGLTPQNKYRAFVNPDTGLMERWYHYRDAADPDPSTITGWAEWRQVGPLLLSPERPTPEGPSRIRFENLQVETQVPAGVFDSPPG
jgi:hypothetical protein